LPANSLRIKPINPTVGPPAAAVKGRRRYVNTTATTDATAHDDLRHAREPLQSAGRRVPSPAAAG
jgi:hypothetical protein